MKKTELASKIIASVEGTQNARVRDFNRRVLAELSDVRFTGDVDEEAVTTVKRLLQDFLNETWPEEPEAHKYVIGSCLALTFLFERPMHPQETVHYITRVEGGKENYYCSFHEEGTLCDFCAARSMRDKTLK